MKCSLVASVLSISALAAAADPLKTDLESAYREWRDAVVRKDISAWQRSTAPHRRMEVRNRIVSEKRSFPSAVFDLPAPPPAIDNLRFLESRQNGPTAKASYFGKIDFGVGGKPTDNLLVLSFVRGGSGWLYDRADYVSLAGLPDVRKELAAGDLKYLRETPEAQPNGIVPPTPVEAPAAKTIAKVYVFCPGREVRVQVNKISQHRFANAQESEVVIGGAVDGANEVQYTVRRLDGSTGKEALAIRVYLMSEIAGVKPIKVYEYQVAEGGAVQPSGTGFFMLDAAIAAKLQGR
jgi:hypothetical protein